MEIKLDVNVITKPMRDARDALAAEKAELERQIAAIEHAAQVEAAQVLKRGAEEAAPVVHQLRVREAHIARWDRLIAEEERAAQRPAAPSDPYRPPPVAGQPVAGRQPYPAETGPMAVVDGEVAQ